MDNCQRSPGILEDGHPAVRLLHLLNPKGKTTLPLDDLVRTRQRHLLLRVPVSHRAEVKVALQAYIFEKKTFAIPAEDLLDTLKGLSVLSAPKPSEPRRKPSLEPPLMPSTPEAKVPAIPASIRKAIRNLSVERQFIAYGSEMNVSPFKPADGRRGSKAGLEEGHRRGASVHSRENHSEEKSYAAQQARKTVLRSALQPQDKRPPSPIRVLSTPKRGRTLPVSLQPRVVVPSLKEGMEKLLREREGNGREV